MLPINRTLFSYQCLSCAHFHSTGLRLLPCDKKKLKWPQAHSIHNIHGLQIQTIKILGTYSGWTQPQKTCWWYDLDHLMCVYIKGYNLRWSRGTNPRVKCPPIVQLREAKVSTIQIEKIYLLSFKMGNAGKRKKESANAQKEFQQLLKFYVKNELSSTFPWDIILHTFNAVENLLRCRSFLIETPTSHFCAFLGPLRKLLSSLRTLFSELPPLKSVLYSTSSKYFFERRKRGLDFEVVLNCAISCLFLYHSLKTIQSVT